MSRAKLTPVRVFVECTGDLQNEREAVKNEIDGVNTDIAHDRGIHLQFLDWRDVSSVVGPLPEQVILDELPVDEWDIFIGILWHRFGTPTGVTDPDSGQPYEGGTEQEFRRAYQLYKQTGHPIIRFYRCKRDAPLDKLGPGQLARVSAFFQDFERGGAHPGLLEYYTDLDDFKDSIRKGLIRALRNVP